MMVRRAFLALFLATSAALFACVVPQKEPFVPDGVYHLVVLHTNDVHGQLLPNRGRGGLRRLAGRVAEIEAELVGRDEGLLLLDGGDWFQGTPEGKLDEGKAFLGLMTRVGFDAMAVGNHELDYGVEHLERLINTVSPPALCANVRDPDTGERVDWGDPYFILRRGESGSGWSDFCHRRHRGSRTPLRAGSSMLIRSSSSSRSWTNWRGAWTS